MAPKPIICPDCGQYPFQLVRHTCRPKRTVDDQAVGVKASELYSLMLEAGVNSVSSVVLIGSNLVRIAIQTRKQAPEDESWK